VLLFVGNNNDFVIMVIVLEIFKSFYYIQKHIYAYPSANNRPNFIQIYTNIAVSLLSLPNDRCKQCTLELEAYQGKSLSDVGGIFREKEATWKKKS
jgi:hypothetical protein